MGFKTIFDETGRMDSPCLTALCHHGGSVETQQVLHGVEPDINMIVRVHHLESPAGASNRFPRLSASTSSDVLDTPISFPVAMN